MGLLRRRRPEDSEPEERPRHGVYRVEVDSERHHFHDDVPFSFWSSAKIIFLLSVLLWWLPQSAGYMVAGYVGGRRAGAPWKAVVAALIPVFMIYGVNAAYAHGYATAQIDFLSGLPVSIATAIGGAVPFLQPYTEFVVNYLATFVEALQRLFGMGSNGYMVTVAFAYIGGIVADQARREIGDKEGASTRVNIVQPIVERLHLSERDEDERIVRGRQPSARHARGHPVPLSEYRKVPAQVLSSRRALPPPRRRPPPEDEDRPPAREVEAPRANHRPRDVSAQTQRFVERALRNYERPHPPRHARD